MRLSAASVAATEWFQSSPSVQAVRRNGGLQPVAHVHAEGQRRPPGPRRCARTASCTVVISLRGALHDELARRSSAAGQRLVVADDLDDPRDVRNVVSDERREPDRARRQRFEASGRSRDGIEIDHAGGSTRSPASSRPSTQRRSDATSPA